MSDLGGDRCTGGCEGDGSRCRGLWLEQRKCCPDCTHRAAPPPPGRTGTLWPALAAPAAMPTSLQVVTSDGTSPAIRDLPMAALRAAAAAQSCGESWLVAPDLTYCHVASDGVVTPDTGWATVAQRLITARNTP